MEKLYESLGEGEDSFRVLQLFPDDDGSKIRTQLVKAKMSAAPTFYAVSHCWGPAGDEVEVLVNDQSVLIRRHLWLCLQQMRRHNRFPFLWVDALCISQDDAAERNRQVRLIGRVIPFDYRQVNHRIDPFCVS